MEIIVVTPFMAHGRRVEADEVIDLPVADAAYVVGLGRARFVEAAAGEPEVVKPARRKPARRKKAA